MSGRFHLDRGLVAEPGTGVGRLRGTDTGRLRGARAARLRGTGPCRPSLAERIGRPGRPRRGGPILRGLRGRPVPAAAQAARARIARLRPAGPWPRTVRPGDCARGQNLRRPAQPWRGAPVRAGWGPGSAIRVRPGHLIVGVAAAARPVSRRRVPARPGPARVVVPPGPARLVPASGQVWAAARPGIPARAARRARATSSIPVPGPGRVWAGVTPGIPAQPTSRSRADVTSSIPVPGPGRVWAGATPGIPAPAARRARASAPPGFPVPATRRPGLAVERGVRLFAPLGAAPAEQPAPPAPAPARRVRFRGPARRRPSAVVGQQARLAVRGFSPARCPVLSIPVGPAPAGSALPGPPGFCWLPLQGAGNDPAPPSRPIRAG
ncbi:MAG: hypothetical protein ACLPKI_11740 [Streptosporangiaceae bacterium]